jgi:hypothetical protein
VSAAGLARRIRAALASATASVAGGPTTDARHRRASVMAVVAAVGVAASCGPAEERPDIRLWSENFAFEVSVDSGPPRARERVVWKVVVRDKNTRQFVEGGEGRLFAESLDHKRVWNGLLPAPELGTYMTTLNFVTAGDWAIGLQFRRDSLAPLERVDWMQTVRPAR